MRDLEDVILALATVLTIVGMGIVIAAALSI